MQFYSHGYNIYIPSKLPLFHLYHRQEIDKDSHYLWLDMKEGELREKYDAGTRHGYETAKDIMLGKNHIYVGAQRDLRKFYDKIQCEVVNGELKKQK